MNLPEYSLHIITFSKKNNYYWFYKQLYEENYYTTTFFSGAKTEFAISEFLYNDIFGDRPF